MKFSVEEAADHLGLSVATIRRRCAEGSLDAEKVGRAWVIEVPDPPTAAQPVEDYLWCLNCGEPHGFYDGRLVLTGEDRTSLACLVPVRSKSLPQGWEGGYEAHAAYSPVGEFEGYDLYTLSPEPDPEIHRPMYYLEAE